MYSRSNTSVNIIALSLTFWV